MPKLRCHVFVCRNTRGLSDRPSCSGRGSAEVFARLTEAVAANPELRGQIAVTECGCLGPCFDGPNLVIYPDAVWYAGVAPDDVTDIVEQHLLGGQPVDRLIYEAGTENLDDDDDDV